MSERISEIPGLEVHHHDELIGRLIVVAASVSQSAPPRPFRSSSSNFGRFCRFRDPGLCCDPPKLAMDPTFSSDPQPDRDTRFRLAIQKNRAVVLPTAAVIGFLLKATVGIDATYLQISLVIAVALLSALLVYQYYLRGLHHRTGVTLDAIWLLVDMGIITYGIHLSGGIDSAWVPWYLANISGAAFAVGPGAAAIVALGDTIAYLGILVYRGDVQWATTEMLRPISIMAILYAASFFFLRGVSDLQRKRLRIESLGENERRKVEELTRVTAALEQRSAELAEANLSIRESDRLKSQFLANMSHELRTPLNSIIGFSEILSSRLGERLETEEIRFLDHIHNSGEHLLEIINDILDLSKIEAGKMPMVVEKVEIPEIVNGICSVMRPIASERGIRFEVNLDSDLPAIEADPVKVKQIFYNLLSNAVKFSHDDSGVSISALHVGARTSRLGVEAVDIAVSDQGVGIDPADRKLIFEAFRQVDGSAGRKHQGTGLGLALVRRLVQLHGGQVELETSVGVGSTFTVSLPVRSPLGLSSTASNELAEGSIHPDVPKILVVEDDPTAFETIREALDETPYYALRATNAREALALARKYQPVAITLDLILPGEDGWEVLRQLRSDATTRNIPVIVVSMIDDRELGCCAS